MSVRPLWGSVRNFSGSARAYASGASNSDDSITHYERLDLAPNASIKDIKAQFKRLSKKYHPDLNSHLTPEEKETNNTNFVKILSAYDTLKDVKRKKQYDMELRVSGHQQSAAHAQRRSPATEWHNKYYGEAKYYSRARSNDSQSYTASGLNTNRHRVHYGPGYDDESTHSKFSGRHKNYGDRFDVPHFDYNEHLLRNLKFEQRMITRNISDDQKEKIISQLSKSGEKLSEELITKHLMRHVHHGTAAATSANTSTNIHSTAKQNHTPGRSYAASTQGNSTYNKSPNYQYMYQGPESYSDNSGGSAVFKTCMVLGGAGSSLYLLYNIFN